MKTPKQEAAREIAPFIEAGEAFRRLGGLPIPAAGDLEELATKKERYDVIVIGGGQAGLSVG
jgi:hypothetical protein